MKRGLTLVAQQQVNIPCMDTSFLALLLSWSSCRPKADQGAAPL